MDNVTMRWRPGGVQVRKKHPEEDVMSDIQISPEMTVFEVTEKYPATT